MTKIKAISHTSNEWIIGCGIIPSNLPTSNMLLPNGDIVIVKTSTVSRFIGRYDILKTPIFENDLVEAKTPYGELIKTVIWEPERCGFFLKSDFVAYDHKNLYSIANKRMKVIGNIYDQK